MKFIYGSKFLDSSYSDANDNAAMPGKMEARSYWISTGIRATVRYYSLE